VEAKVDEPFGLSIRDAYLGAKVKQIFGESTKVPERIEKLLRLHFSKPDVSMFDILYQLLSATAGTLAALADISVFYIVVFKTLLYDEFVGAENYRDYVNFINNIGGKLMRHCDEEALAHELIIGGKRLVCIHECFEL